MKCTFDTSTTIEKSVISARGLSLSAYITELRQVADTGSYGAGEASINLPVDEDLLETVTTLAATWRTPDLRYIFVIGIGGSNLGTKAIYDALFSSRDVVVHTHPRLIFVDTNDAQLLTAYRDLIWSCVHPTECLLVSISKSGGTTETLANTEILLGVLREKWRVDTDRLVVIADTDSPYGVTARAKGITTLPMPTLVGGRFSVLSAVGLFPLALVGVPIEELHKGAAAMRLSCLHPTVNENPAAQSALVQAVYYEKGMHIHNTFVFDGRLESIGRWYRQLLGESIGKERPDGTLVGITPVVSVGSTDLHSVGQLYLGGPKNTVTTFLYNSVVSDQPKVPAEKRVFSELVPMIAGKSTDEIMSAILEGTKEAYNNRKLPFIEVTLEGITPSELGAFLQFKMIEVMYLGKLLTVNPFDQPAVELYKIGTKRILEGTTAPETAV
jgi:glucose-6-phosphate isomerase